MNNNLDTMINYKPHQYNLILYIYTNLFLIKCARPIIILDKNNKNFNKYEEQIYN